MPEKDKVSLRETGIQALFPLFLILVSLVLHFYLPNQQLVKLNSLYSIILLGLVALIICSYSLGFFYTVIRTKLVYYVPLVSVGIIALTLWELLSLKFNILPLPFFPSPDKVLDAFSNDYGVIALSILYSLRLLFVGYFLGVLLGIPTGIAMGWYKKFNYWINPLLKFVGPVPSTAWIPLVLVIFPTSFTASIFLIALATWFPVTVMTWSGVAGVSNSYFEVAKTLGADERYLITKVALPAALPLVFIGLFMGLGVSFVTLIVAEMLGVKAGLGWYIQWAMGWGEYYKVYAALIVMSVMFSLIISLLFKFRDKLLVWQKGVIKW